MAASLLAAASVSLSMLPNRPMEPMSLALAARDVPVAFWARRRAEDAVSMSGCGSSASRWAA